MCAQCAYALQRLKPCGMCVLKGTPPAQALTPGHLHLDV